MDLSVVIAAYNISGFIEDCIASILEQDSHATVELIAVDDGSTDGTGDILKALADASPDRMVVVHQPNAGLSAARNTGLEHASGEFIWFIDGDDMIAPGAIESVMNTLQHQALDCVHFGYREVDEHGRMQPAGHVPIQTWICPGTAFFHRAVQSFHIATTAWTFVYRRALLVQSGLRFEPDLLHEDMLHTPLLLQQAKRFLPLEETPYLYRQRSGSITQDIDPSKAKARVDSLIHIFQRLSDLRRGTDDAPFREALGWYCYHIYRKAVREARAANLKQSLRQLERLNLASRAWSLFPAHDWQGRLKKLALSTLYAPSTLTQRSYRDET